MRKRRKRSVGRNGEERRGKREGRKVGKGRERGGRERREE